MKYLRSFMIIILMSIGVMAQAVTLTFKLDSTIKSSSINNITLAFGTLSPIKEGNAFKIRFNTPINVPSKLDTFPDLTPNMFNMTINNQEVYDASLQWYIPLPTSNTTYIISQEEHTFTEQVPSNPRDPRSAKKTVTYTYPIYIIKPAK